MDWHDTVLMLASWMFAPALVPMLFAKEKPPISSSILTCIALAFILMVYLDVGWWLAAVSTGLTLLAWFMLAMQKIMRR